MAKHTLAIYWDFSSPFSYLGATQAEALAARTGAELVWRPMLLGGVFRAIGQVDAPVLTWSEAKRMHTFHDLNRWAEYWGIPFKFPSRFPTNSLKAMRTWLALPEERRGAFREKTYRAYWAEDRDITDDAVLRELITAAGSSEGADEVLARTQDPTIKQALIDATNEAVERGVFGAPTWIVDDKELFWGQDRIPLVERALGR
jgi:2-hydroxychromene-2-carboxylate isomerase